MDDAARRAALLGVGAGCAGPVLFVLSFIINGLLQPGYDGQAQFVSELSIGPSGWVQILTFLVCGSLIFLFGHGLVAAGRGGVTAPMSAARVVEVIGLALLVSGPFVSDSSVVPGPASPHGVVHGIAGAVVFGLAPVACLLVFLGLRRDPRSVAFAWWSLAVGVALVVGIVLLKLSQQTDNALYPDKGVVQRVVLVVFMGWLVSLALWLARAVRVRNARHAYLTR